MTFDGVRAYLDKLRDEAQTEGTLPKDPYLIDERIRELYESLQPVEKRVANEAKNRAAPRAGRSASVSRACAKWRVNGDSLLIS